MYSSASNLRRSLRRDAQACAVPDLHLSKNPTQRYNLGFSLDLKILPEEACLMDSGNTESTISLHLSLDLGVNNRSWLDDRRGLIGWYSVLQR